MPRRMRAILASLLVLLVCAGFGLWLLAGSTWQIRSVRLEGTNDPTVRAAIGGLDLRGQNIFRSDLADAERRLDALPVVASAHAYRVYPDSVLFRVTLRAPALRWHTRAQTVVLAADGTVLGAPDAAHARAWGRLPLVEDPAAALFGGKTARAGQRVPRETVEMAVQLLQALSQDADARLDYSAERGFVAVAGGGQHIIFGTPADAATLSSQLPSKSWPATDGVASGVTLQLRELAQMRAMLARQRIAATLIDLRWGPYPYYRTD